MGEVQTASSESEGSSREGMNSEPQAQDARFETLRQQFDQLGQELYGAQWQQVSRQNVERISSGQTTDAAQLNIEQVEKLIDGLKRLKRNRALAKAGASRNKRSAR